MAKPNNANISKNCNFSSYFGDFNRDSAWDCLSKVQLAPSNETDELVDLLSQDQFSQSDGKSYISMNFAFAESLLIMIGLFTNLVVSLFYG